MLPVLKLESYGPVLKMMGNREDPSSETVVWGIAILLSVPLLLYVTNRIRRKVQKRRNLARRYEVLEKLSNEKDLNYIAQVTAERLASHARLENPAQMLTSIDVFDQAVAAWMPKVQKMPWLEMEEQIDRLDTLRKKLGFRYRSPDRQPQNTRELVLGQKLYVLARGKKRLKLLSAPIIDLDDLAICVEVFSSKRPVRLKKNQEMWVFFYSELGSEYRFKTKVLREVKRPTPYLMVQHAESLTYDDGRKTFSFDHNLASVIDWLPTSKTQQATPSEKLFERFEHEIESLPIHLHELSGSGLTLTTDAEIEDNDLIRLKGHKELPPVLEDKIARAVKASSHGVRFKFINLTPDDRHRLLRYLAPRVSPETFMKKTTQKSAAPSN